MGKILDKILGVGAKAPAATAVETVGTRPYTTGWQGEMYQQVLVRSCIERIAEACSKLKPEVQGTARPRIRRAVETSPNQFQTWPAFLRRSATLYFNNTTVCVVPEYNERGVHCGYYPVPLAHADVVDHAGEYWLRWTTFDGDTRAVELKLVAIVTRFQYASDWFGDGNILATTLSLLKAQEAAQVQSINDSAQLRFIAKLSGQTREDDMYAKRDRFYEDNFGDNNGTALMIHDATMEVEQLKAQNWTIPTDEMERIENNVFDYFGINRRILQNSYDENIWDAFYEGCIEPFALALGEALTQATFTMRERPANRITFSSNRLEYASAASKRNMIKDMTDRGIISINDALEILQMPTLGPDGDVRMVRGEYKVGNSIADIMAAQQAQIKAKSGVREQNSEHDADKQEGDTIRGDSEGYGSSGDTDTGDVTSTNQDRWSENQS